MNIEQKMAYIRKAIELGAQVEVKFHGLVQESEAKEIVSELQPTNPLTFKFWENTGTYWYQTDDWDNNLETVVFFKEKEAKEVTA